MHNKKGEGLGCMKEEKRDIFCKGKDDDMKSWIQNDHIVMSDIRRDWAGKYTIWV